MRKQDKNKGKQKKRKQAQEKARAKRRDAGFGDASFRPSAGSPASQDLPFRRASQAASLKARAMEGDPDAQAAFGFFRLKGMDGKEPDAAKAAEWFQKAIDNGSDEACAALAALCLAGRGVPRDPARARELFALGVERGNPVSMHGLARCLAQGTGGGRDHEAACRLFEQACDEGLHEAAPELVQLRLAMPENAEGFARALALLEQACDEHCPQAMRLYASLQLDGRGVGADARAAAGLLVEATRLQGSGAWREGALDQLLDEGDEGSGEECADERGEGMAWKAIEDAWKDLAGIVQRPDLPEDVRAMALARLKENWDSGGSAMMHGLGLACLFGHFGGQDLAKAREMFTECAQYLNPESRAYLGAMDFWGLGCGRDMVRGAAAMAQAAEDGSLSACRFLARIYAKGDGGWPADAGKAERYRSMAASLAESQAVYLAGTDGKAEDEDDGRIRPAEGGDERDWNDLAQDDLDWKEVLGKPPFADGQAWLSLWT